MQMDSRKAKNNIKSDQMLNEWRLVWRVSLWGPVGADLNALISLNHRRVWHPSGHVTWLNLQHLIKATSKQTSHTHYNPQSTADRHVTDAARSHTHTQHMTHDTRETHTSLGFLPADAPDPKPDDHLTEITQMIDLSSRLNKRLNHSIYTSLILLSLRHYYSFY